MPAYYPSDVSNLLDDLVTVLPRDDAIAELEMIARDIEARIAVLKEKEPT